MDEDGMSRLMNAKQRKCSLEDDQTDRISNLPELLLFHILSFLNMEDVMKTTLLSRQWRYFWTNTPILNFEPPWDELKKREKYGDILDRVLFSSELKRREKYGDFIDRVLFAHEGSTIKKFRLSYLYINDTKAFQVDSWIRFAMMLNVKEFELDFVCGMEPVPSLLRDLKIYKLHSSCFKSASLTSLTLRFCNLNLPASMCLSSLKVLSLELLELSHDTLEKLTSSCPVLEELFLRQCNWRSDFRIYIPELALKSLKIDEFCKNESYRKSEVEIYAPNLFSLRFLTRMQRSKYHLKGPSSLVNLSFDIEGDNRKHGEHERNVLVELLQDLHVNDLKLDGWSIQALSIRGLQGLPALSCKATSLELQTGLSKWELPGIAYMLRSCPLLEFLIISSENVPHMLFTHEFRNKYDYDVREYWKSQELSFPSLLQNVKTVKLLSFSKEEFISSMQNEAKAMEELVKAHKVEIELVRYFLQKCTVLQEMIITRPKHNSLAGKPLELPLKFVQKLLDFPRVSIDAELIFL